MFRFSDRRARAVGLTTVLVASSLAIIGGPPATAATGSSSYTVTCTSGAIGPNPLSSPLPFPVTITSTTVSPDPAFPTGVAVNVTGDVQVTVVGAVLAGLYAAGAGGGNVQLTGMSVQVTATNDSSPNFPISLTGTTPMDGRQIAGGISTVLGSTTVTSPSGAFQSSDVGKFISTSSAVLGAGLASGTTIVGYTDANTVTVSAAALGNQTATPAGIAVSAVVTNTGVNLGSYVSAGASGGTMNFSLLPGPMAAPVTLVLGPLNVPANLNPCGVSGSGSFGSAALFDPPPVATSQTLNVGTSTATPITLAATSSDPTPATEFTIETLPAAGTLTIGATTLVVGDVVPVGTPVVYNSGATADVQSFEFSASDGVSSSTTNGTVTLNVGTPTVQQPITQEITPGQLVLSCSAPGSPVYPDLNCDPIALPSVELDGTDQLITVPMNQLHVSDNRGDVTVGWSLTAKVIDQTVTGGGTFKGLVNTDFGAVTSDPANQIEASYLSIGGISCAAVSPAPAAIATTGGGGTFATDQALCSAAAGSSIGTFTVDGNFTLEVPSSKAAGTYEGTVEYLVI